MKTVSALLCAILVSGGCATSGSASSPGSPRATDPAQGGSAATDFTLRDLNGDDVRLSDYAGKVVLIDFWASWCTPCEAELQHLQRLYAENQQRGFVILAIAMDGPETSASVRPIAERYKLTFPVLLDEETRVVGIYNPKRTAPLSVLIDQKGHIVRVRQGYNAGDEKFVEADVKRLLAP